MFNRSCKACAAKDSEIAFLRSMLTSARTIVREPDVVQIVGPGQQAPESAHERSPDEAAFLRNTINEVAWTPLVSEQDMRDVVAEANAERRSRIAARRSES